MSEFCWWGPCQELAVPFQPQLLVLHPFLYGRKTRKGWITCSQVMGWVGGLFIVEDEVSPSSTHQPSTTTLPGRERNSVAPTASAVCNYLLMGKMEISPIFVLLNSYLKGWNLKVMKKTSPLNLSFNLLTFFLLFFLPGEVSALVWKAIIPLVRRGVNWRRFSIPRELSFQYLSFLLNIEMEKILYISNKTASSSNFLHWCDKVFKSLVNVLVMLHEGTI